MNHQVDQSAHEAHTHNYLELAFILGGSARHITVQGESLCCPGQLVVVPEGAWHAYANCQRLELVNLLFSPRLLGHELAWLEEDAVMRRLLGIELNRHVKELFKIDLLKSDMERLRASLAALESVYRAGANKPSMVAKILNVLEAVRPSFVHNAPAPMASNGMHPTVMRGMDLLGQQIGDEWTLSNLAECLNLNPSYLVRLFHAETGQPPMKYLAERRAKMAANLLLSTRLRVGEIGQQVGWSDPKVFSRNFRKYFGMKASDYRRRMLGVLN